MSHLRARIKKAKNEQRRLTKEIRRDHMRVAKLEKRIGRMYDVEAREVPKRLRA
jgi:septal ring factor EnvC (AmiA/AmiB activator)